MNNQRLFVQAVVITVATGVGGSAIASDEQNRSISDNKVIVRDLQKSEQETRQISRSSKAEQKATHLLAAGEKGEKSIRFSFPSNHMCGSNCHGAMWGEG